MGSGLGEGLGCSTYVVLLVSRKRNGLLPVLAGVLDVWPQLKRA